MFQKILICLDGSDLSEQILPYATEVARRFGSQITLLEVTAPPSAVVEPATGYFHASSPDKIQRREDEANEYLQGIARRVRRQGLTVDLLTLPGDPGRAIVEYAAENEIDLIALGTHGRSGLSRLAFGSVAEHVIKESGLPVLARRPRPAE
jgi:nucleotide-binding universal stress UspA family protein